MRKYMEPTESESYLEHVLGKDVVNLLKCSICLDYYAEPTILPCGHTFCHPCLKNIGDYQIKISGPLLKEGNKDTLEIACPTCRKKVTYGQIVQKDKGAAKSNYALASIVESLRTLHLRNKVEQSTNTETDAYCKDRINKIQKNIDSVFEAVRRKGSVIIEAKKDIEMIRKQQDEIQALNLLTFQCANTTETQTDMNFYKTPNYQTSNFSNVKVQNFMSQSRLQQSSSPAPYQNSSPDPGYVDPAILSYASSEVNNFQYGGNLDSNMYQLLASQYGQ